MCSGIHNLSETIRTLTLCNDMDKSQELLGNTQAKVMLPPFEVKRALGDSEVRGYEYGSFTVDEHRGRPLQLDSHRAQKLPHIC